jgi:hypothetical protein
MARHGRRSDQSGMAAAAKYLCNTSAIGGNSGLIA